MCWQAASYNAILCKHFHQIHCDNGLTGIGAASIIVPSEIAEFEELDGDLGEGFKVADGAVRVPTGAGSRPLTLVAYID